MKTNKELKETVDLVSKYSDDNFDYDSVLGDKVTEEVADKVLEDIGNLEEQ